VNFRGWERLSQCLESIRLIADSRFSFEVIVVDNRSNDGFFQQFSQSFPEFSFILNIGNHGFANGCNFGASKSKGAFLLFLNPDTIIHANALYALLTEIRLRKVYSIVSCLQETEDGIKERPYGRFLSPVNLTGWLRAMNQLLFERKEKLFYQTENYLYPDWVSGSVVMISRISFEGLNGWDDNFWMYFEDVDLCRRALDKNGEIVLLKTVCVEHNHGGSSRINKSVTAITKTYVNISRHFYISKHQKGGRAYYMHTFLILNHLLFGLLPAISGIILFFVKDLNVRTHIYFQLIAYYLNVLWSGTWLSRRSVNYLPKSGNF